MAKVNNNFVYVYCTLILYTYTVLLSALYDGFSVGYLVLAVNALAVYFIPKSL